MTYTPPPGPPTPPGAGRAGEDYLWDRSGEPDELAARLESMLAPAGLRGTELPTDTGTPVVWVMRARVVLALAAMVLFAVSAGVWYGLRPARGWRVEAVAGAPTAGGSKVKAGGTLRIGAWLETDGASSASVSVADIGRLDVSPGSRVRIRESADARHALDLDHGRIEATIHAPPRLFFVHTAAALATDMGCRYELSMPRDGKGLLRVTLGWVLLEAPAGSGSGMGARVPRGLSCAIDPVSGPGTPFREGSKIEGLVAALDERGWGEVGDVEIEELVRGAGGGDEVTLWHVLQRVPAERRGAVIDVLQAIIALPEPLDRAELERLDADALERLWGEVMWAG